MGRFYHRYLLYLTVFCCLLPSIACASQLQQSLNKYAGTTVSQQALQRLAPYNHFINYYSQFSFFRPRHKVSPDFIRALIFAESNANPRAVSNKGARGLGQIIYTTGKQAAKELSRTNYRFYSVSKQRLANLQEDDLFDPAVNILLTCYLIAKYNYKFDGKLELVLSAWNAGENLAILQKGQHAPYPETVDLIGKVNSYYLALLQKRPSSKTPPNF